MTATLTATSLARDLSDVLSRVRYRGESFVIERAGEPVAVVSPPPVRAGASLATLAALIQEHGRDPSFADDLEAIQASQPPAPDSPWPSW